MRFGRWGKEGSGSERSGESLAAPTLGGEVTGELDEVVAEVGVVTPVTDATFDALVLDSELPVVVDYWAEWCGPCRMMAPILAELAAAHPQIRFVSVDTMDNPQTAAQYGILALPTFHVFRNGELIHQISGAKPKHTFYAEIERALA